MGWCQSSALLVRRSAAEQVGYLDPDFFVYSDETDFCRRLRDAGWRILFEPAAVATHHNQLSNDRAAEARRLAEFHRNRDLYMRKHHSTAERLLTRALWVVAYLERAVLGRSGRMLRHARHELVAGHGDGVREAAEARNAASPPEGSPQPPEEFPGGVRLPAPWARAAGASRALGKVAPWWSPPWPARSVRPASCSPASASCCSAAWRCSRWPRPPWCSTEAASTP